VFDGLIVDDCLYQTAFATSFVSLVFFGTPMKPIQRILTDFFSCKKTEPVWNATPQSVQSVFSLLEHR
jgi:hypothetical protein